ncbi:translation initiation factor 2 [Solwaraspora sp. WMMD1047]|uniref:translation initiation factor 2 n=1 Tax=Solwaraspora sp. WMMD1047 TaxID=3016102 RepID=UPI0024164F3B|nr:translation initiation factor 2 [Solwaraspora sp. WMMD1047]MDG4833496.1 translation initiation factor 2 [Solwaraspora sp. WMMD1047]
MTTGNGDPADEGFWRRPPGQPDGLRRPDQPAPEAAGPVGRPSYPGPPPSTPPPAGWRPPVHVQPPPPGRLPPQDLPALDAAEGSARTLTYGIGMLTTAVLLVVMCLLCSRVLF